MAVASTAMAPALLVLDFSFVGSGTIGEVFWGATLEASGARLALTANPAAGGWLDVWQVARPTGSAAAGADRFGATPKRTCCWTCRIKAASPSPFPSE